ncbi:type I-F CRISPR-associated helicase Cas3f [Marinobacter sp. M3C]|uniref:type I-F CRISPR-associated helicase Cas3f n=1 Tax=Marinobacter sp. M3C TaxID=2917715 RepID=UPI00200D01F3|nr:type I-F CRISPR-associated helicase Cas3f [Marinobacter sp. M3C]UQG58971.1 type I-F CRISPR-associated helicase Cas3f [Marinobacter sp. M3C]
MFVTFVCMSEKKSISRVRRVLDRYAIRIGKQTWNTPITKEALDDVYRVVRQGATRHTAVACYRNNSTRSMDLIWTVGRRDQFGANGAVAVAHKRRAPAPIAPWVRTAALVAQCSGFNHDIGKATLQFQNKLTTSAKGGSCFIRDRVRHEWVSLVVFEHWRDAMAHWERDGPSVTESADNPPRLHESFPAVRPDAQPQLLKGLPANPVRNIRNALDFCTLTHHGLLGVDARNLTDKPPKVEDTPGGSAHVRTSQELVRDQPDSLYRNVPDNATFKVDTEKRLWSLTKRVLKRNEDYGDNPHYARGIALIARAALIAADHEVSSQRYPGTVAKRDVKATLYANTKPLPSRGHASQRRALDQPLDWHLENVGRMAGRWVHRIATLNDEFEGLTEGSRAQLRVSSGIDRFSWQDRAAETMARSVSDAQLGNLVFNMAGTGSGKTLANIKIANALVPESAPLRLSIALNLRSLTLQTASSLKRQSGLMPSEVATVIGDRFAISAYELSGASIEDGERGSDDFPELESDVVGGDGVGYPEWLDKWLTSTQRKRQKPVKKLLTAPALVSTSDYLVDAGDPSRQGRHVIALLRVASSDLILDEADQYDSKALIAMARVVQLSALFNRNVIVSSATLSLPVVGTLTAAYLSGVAMRDALKTPQTEPVTTAPVWFVDDFLPTEVHQMDVAGRVGERYGARVQRLMDVVTRRPAARLGYIQSVRPPTADIYPIMAMANAVTSSIHRLHKSHGWSDERTGKRVSFGVVRVANIRPCVELAAALCGNGIYVTAYHAQDLKGRRWMKEQLFDDLFTRSESASQPVNHPHIRAILDKAPESDITFVVVATPVEEVGRDHDFDWAIIEPSSAASIVQMAGRVNRHRLLTIIEPNIAILDRNLLSLKGESRCFSRPGNNQLVAASAQPMTHQLAGAWGWMDSKMLPITSALQFGHQAQKPELACLDERAFTKELLPGHNAMTADKPGYYASWIATPFYKEYRLRSNSQRMDQYRFIRTGPDSAWESEQLHVSAHSNSTEWKSVAVTIAPLNYDNAATHLWASWSLDEMDLILNNLETDEAFLTGAFEFSVRATSGHGDLIFNEAFGGPLVIR